MFLGCMEDILSGVQFKKQLFGFCYVLSTGLPQVDFFLGYSDQKLPMWNLEFYWLNLQFHIQTPLEVKLVRH